MCNISAAIGQDKQHTTFTAPPDIYGTPKTSVGDNTAPCGTPAGHKATCHDYRKSPSYVYQPKIIHYSNIK